MDRFSMRIFPMIDQGERPMPNLNRRLFLAAAASGAAVRTLPALKTAPGKRVLTLVYDKSLGMMRAIDRVVR